MHFPEKRESLLKYLEEAPHENSLEKFPEQDLHALSGLLGGASKQNKGVIELLGNVNVCRDQIVNTLVETTNHPP